MTKAKSPKQTSKDLYADAIKVIPGGVSRNTILRKPYPNYVEWAKGCHVKDIDGITRIDFANNMAALIHGHAHPAIVDAVTEQLKSGTAYTLATEIEVRFAEHLAGRAGSLEKIRFVNSGTEAVMAMIKASRAYTQRPKIAKAEGAYHGTYDFAEVSQIVGPDNWGNINQPDSVPLVQGTPKGVTDNVVIFPFNDIERTLAILDKSADEIAAVLIDPIPHRVGLLQASPEFIEAIYEWTRRNDALLIFDEVITFRASYGGAQEDYKVKPDLTALGKIIGGGFPVGAYGGRADVMAVLDPTAPGKLRFPHSGTFSANPVTMTAGFVTMNLYDHKAIKDLNAITQIAKDQINEAIRIADVPVSVTGSASMFRVHLKDVGPSTYRDTHQTPEENALIIKILDHLFHKENIMMINTCACMFSTVITQKEVDRLTEGMLNALMILKPEIMNLKK